VAVGLGVTTKDVGLAEMQDEMRVFFCGRWSGSEQSAGALPFLVTDPYNV
jgi:hypothetical protein